MVKYEATLVADLRQAIQELASRPKNQLTVREVIESMQDELHQKREEGWSFEELAQVLAEKGLKIAATTLRDYLGSPKQHRIRGKRGSQAGSRQGKGRIEGEQEVKSPVVAAVSTPVKASVIPTSTGLQSSHAGFNEDN